MTTSEIVVKAVIASVISGVILFVLALIGSISMDSGHNSKIAGLFGLAIIGLIWVTWWLIFRNSGVRMRWWMWLLAIYGSLSLLGLIAG